ncbi:NADH dehydrogenase [ubiquinone] 1 alpha subcomplex subunit 6 [Frankliniella fusca]|uniref:NADH dehydrogenase [ubiquinone] 1 alpha subcomplex subunit 6 n=1 Tax=Frankliniella fusca TaxID=407009 RepID=A0AAE1LL99_9NEOP|nr:NADH dehydrogenase [ubiquinone] 1 alpha subcomplex subunit 6 [Frankliniella fusca]
MSSGKAASVVTRQVRPILSLSHDDSRRRVLALYKAWYRQIPHIVTEFDIPKNTKQCQQKLREEFLKHKDVKDIRVIDMLVIKGQMELKETVTKWKQVGHVMAYWKDSVNKKPDDFLGKFLDGKD